MKQYKVTIFAVIALIVALVGYFLISSLIGEKPIDDKVPINRERVLIYHPDNVVKIETHSKEDFVLEKKDGTWISLSHTDLRVDENSMLTLLNSCTNMMGNIIIDEGEEKNLEDFGLNDDPDYFAIYLKDGTSSKLLLGNTNLSGSEFYCMFEGGDKIYSVSGTYLKRLRVTRATITTSRVFNAINDDRINTIELKRRGETKYIIKADFSGDVKGWDLSYPVKIKGNVENINALVSSLTQLIIGDLVSSNVSDLSEYGLDVPTAQYYITDNKSTMSFEIGNKTPDGQNRYCTVNDTNHVYLIAMTKLNFVDNETTTYIHTYAFLENQDVLSNVKIDLEGTIYNLDYEVTDTQENYWFNSINVNMPDKDLRSQFKKITTSMYSLRIEDIEAEPSEKGIKVCSIEYTRKDSTKVLVEFFKRNETTSFIYVNGEYMNGYLYTRRINGDGIDSLKSIINNFISLMNE